MICLDTCRSMPNLNRHGNRANNRGQVKTGLPKSKFEEFCLRFYFILDYLKVNCLVPKLIALKSQEDSYDFIFV